MTVWIDGGTTGQVLGQVWDEDDGFGLGYVEPEASSRQLARLIYLWLKSVH